ncbi:hypothetical protein POVWA1_025020 [Plasmodium ovale wallikeri]|uniref:Uncharacterized protein n=1 Tax=Plasmodium ovale wallikeri TaxID=864142 RepID=A0A1A8YU68_PLAOA|nr:hypothetical protein POVWA1_025020 [Plasmodium ovale wallikeri]
MTTKVSLCTSMWEKRETIMPNILFLRMEKRNSLFHNKYGARPYEYTFTRKLHRLSSQMSESEDLFLKWGVLVNILIFRFPFRSRLQQTRAAKLAGMYTPW